MAKKESKTERTSKGLRESLFKAFDDLRNDDITPQKARELYRTAATILMSVKLEIEAARFVALTMQTGKVKESDSTPTIPVLEL